MKLLRDIVDISEAVKKPAKKRVKSKAKKSGKKSAKKPIEKVFTRPMLKSTNPDFGYFGSVSGSKSEKQAAFERMHRKVRDTVNGASKKEINHKMVTHFLDSEHGRHLADHKSNVWGAQDKDTVDKHIKTRWNTFKKDYNPELFGQKKKAKIQ